LTIKFFDLHNYPLKAREAHRYLFREKALLRETGQALEELAQEKILGQREGFWFLAGRSQLVAERKDKERASRYLRRKLKILGWIFKITPFIRTVAICNNLSFNNATRKSDIDLLILTRKGGLWTARFISTGLVAILGLKKRKFQKVDPGKLCLSFYLSEDYLSLERISSKMGLFLIFWLGLIDPIYDQGLFSRFLEANRWAFRSLPNLRTKSTDKKRRALSLIAFLWEKIIETLPFDLESWLYKWQQKRILGNLPKNSFSQKLIAKKKIFKSHQNNRPVEITQELKRFYSS